VRPAAAAAIVLALAGAARAEPEVTAWRLDAATEVALVEDHRAPLVTLRIVLPAGTWSPWLRDRGGEEAFAIQLHDPEGSLRRRADALGVSLDLRSDERTTELAAKCLTEDLDAMLLLVRDVFANRAFDRRELARWQTAERIAWKAALKEPEFRASQAVARLLFERDDPRRLEWEPPRALERDPEKLAASRDALLRLPRRIVAFWGDLDRDRADAAARDLLPPAAATLPPDLAPRLLPPRPERSDAVDVRLPKLTQTYLRLAAEGIPVDSPDYPAYMVANHVLGGHFYSRLYRALRHQGGDTYGAGSGGYADVVPREYGLYTFTRTANSAAAAAKLRDELARLHAGGITAEERDEAASYLLGREPRRRETPAQVLSEWLAERQLGLAPGTLAGLVARAASTPLDEINRFVTRFFDPTRFTLVRVTRP
jgi:zinc protease